MICYSCKHYDSCQLSWKCSSTMQGCTRYEKEQTNEEYIRQCSTEQLAEWICEITDMCGSKYMCSRCFVRSLCRKDEAGSSPIDTVIEWLKERHHEMS